MKNASSPPLIALPPQTLQDPDRRRWPASLSRSDYPCRLAMRVAVFVLFLIAVLPGRSAVPESALRDTGSQPLGGRSIRGFELYGRGILWWAGDGGCAVETRSDGTLGVRGLISAETHWLEQDCHQTFESAVRDESRVYFVSSGRLYRKALGGQPGEAPLLTVDGVSSPPALPRHTGAIALFRGRIYWTQSDGSVCRIGSAKPDGSDNRLEATVAGRGAIKVSGIEYGLGRPSGIRSLILLTSDGRLYRIPLSESPAPPVLLATDISDFAISQRTILRGNLAGFENVVFASRAVRRVNAPAGVLLKIDLFDDTSETVYDAGGDSERQIEAVAADSRNVYITERRLVCSGLFGCGTQGGSVLRRPLDGSTGWGVIVQDVGGTLPDQIQGGNEGFNLRSDGEWLYFLRGDRIMRIRTDAPFIEFDVEADGLEIVQSVQNLDNFVPIVAHKPAVVRGYARIRSNTTGATQWQMRARLRIFGPRGELVGELNPIQPAWVTNEVHWGARRRNTRSSFQFLVPAEMVPPPVFDFPASYKDLIRLEMEVNGSHSPNELAPPGGNPPYLNNTVVRTARVLRTAAPCVTFFRVATAGQSLVQPLRGADATAFADMIRRAETLFPVERFQPFIHGDVIEDLSLEGFRLTTAPFDLCENGGEGNAGSRMVAGVAARFGTMARTCPGADERFVGLVSATTPCDAPGRGSQGGIASWLKLSSGNPGTGPSLPDSGRVLAHELAHNYGLRHLPTNSANCTFQNPGTDLDSYGTYDPCYIGDSDESAPATVFGFDRLSLQPIAPTAAGDLMSYKNGWFWMSDITWLRLIGAVQQAAAASAREGAAPAAPAPASESPAVLLRGEYHTDSGSVVLAPLTILPKGGYDPIRLTRSEHDEPHLENLTTVFRGQNGSTLGTVPIDFLHPSAHDDASRTDLRFVQLVRIPEGCRSIEILRADRVLAAVGASQNPPVVRVQSFDPLPLGSARVLRWGASDPDGDLLLFSVQFSSDDGATWTTLRIDHPFQEWAVDVDSLPATDKGRLRVLACDGFHVSSSTSDRFVVGARKPSLLVGGVEEGTRLPFGQAAEVFATILNSVDPRSPMPELSWELTGPSPRRAKGDSLSLSGIAPGHYTATLTPDAAPHSADPVRRSFDVLPLEFTESTAPRVDGDCNDDAYAGATHINIPLSDGGIASADIVHALGATYVALTGLAMSPNPAAPARVGIFVDRDGSGGGVPTPDELGVLIDEFGIPYRAVGQGAGWRLDNDPTEGITAAVTRGDGAWTAEVSIKDGILGGWGHPIRLFLHLENQANAASGAWPESGSVMDPGTWTEALMGVAKPAPNQRPEANLQPYQTILVSGDVTVNLDGRASRDPEGTPLSYSWRQTRIPGDVQVQLLDTQSSMPRFELHGLVSTVTLRFELEVSDGQLRSDPAVAILTFVPASSPQRSALTGPGRWDTSRLGFEGVLLWPGSSGDRCEVVASSDLIHWEPIGVHTVDTFRRIVFTDSTSDARPRRFYQARQVQPTRTTVFQSSFQPNTDPGSRWSHRTVSVTPAGARPFLGHFGNGKVTLSLDRLPDHRTIDLDVRLFLINSWDGNNLTWGPDSWQLKVAGGPTLVDSTFATGGQQSFPSDRGAAFPAGTASSEMATLGYVFGGAPSDMVYHFHYSLPHDADSIQIEFSATGLQEIADESWGLESVTVETTAYP